MQRYSNTRTFWITAISFLFAFCFYVFVTRGQSRVIFDRLLNVQNDSALISGSAYNIRSFSYFYTLEAHLEGCNNRFNYTFGVSPCCNDAVDQFLRYNGTDTRFTIYTNYCEPAGDKFFLAGLGMTVSGFAVMFLLLL